MYNPYILVPLATWAIVQLVKFILAAANGNLDLRKLYASGGMPSVHAAVVCSLATTAFLYDGESSHLFGFTATFAAIVIYDSLGVRRATGDQGVALNMVIASLTRDKVMLSDPNVRLREVLGHKPREVVVGAILGVVLAMVLNLNKIGGVLKFLGATPVNLEIYIYAGIASVILIAGIILRIVLARRKSNILFILAKRIFWATLTSAVVLGALELGAFENVPILDWRLWSLLALVVIGAYKLSIIVWAANNVPAARKAEQTGERLAKWLPKPNKKKAKKR